MWFQTTHETRLTKKEAIATRNSNCNIVTFFFFFFLPDSSCGATEDGCRGSGSCCCCRRGSSSSSSGNRAYCKPGAEKQSFVKWPERGQRDFELISLETFAGNSYTLCVFLSFEVKRFVVVPLQPHFEHVVLRTASSVILLPVWSRNCLRRLASCLQITRRE